MHTFSGLVSFSMNPLEPPKTHLSSKFHSSGNYDTVLVIKPDDRARDQKKGINYVCVYAHLTSTYSVMIHELETKTSFTYIEDSFVEVSEVKGQE